MLILCPYSTSFSINNALIIFLIIFQDKLKSFNFYSLIRFFSGCNEEILRNLEFPISVEEVFFDKSSSPLLTFASPTRNLLPMPHLAWSGIECPFEMVSRSLRYVSLQICENFFRLLVCWSNGHHSQRRLRNMVSS